MYKNIQGSFIHNCVKLGIQMEQRNGFFLTCGMEYYTTMRRYRNTELYGWISQILHWVEEARSKWYILSVQFSSVAQSCPTSCDPMNRNMPGLPVHHQLPEFTQTHIHQVSDAIQPSHPLSSPFPPAPNPSQHQSLFQWINPSHEVAKVLEFQL